MREDKEQVIYFYRRKDWDGRGDAYLLANKEMNFRDESKAEYVCAKPVRTSQLPKLHGFLLEFRGPEDIFRMNLDGLLGEGKRL